VLNAPLDVIQYDQGSIRLRALIEKRRKHTQALIGSADCHKGFADPHQYPMIGLVDEHPTQASKQHMARTRSLPDYPQCEFSQDNVATPEKRRHVPQYPAIHRRRCLEICEPACHSTSAGVGRCCVNYM
jgi:hypothetical protein